MGIKTGKRPSKNASGYQPKKNGRELGPPPSAFESSARPAGFFGPPPLPPSVGGTVWPSGGWQPGYKLPSLREAADDPQRSLLEQITIETPSGSFNAWDYYEEKDRAVQSGDLVPLEIREPLFATRVVFAMTWIAMTNVLLYATTGEWSPLIWLFK